MGLILIKKGRLATLGHVSTILTLVCSDYSLFSSDHVTPNPISHLPKIVEFLPLSLAQFPIPLVWVRYPFVELNRFSQSSVNSFSRVFKFAQAIAHLGLTIDLNQHVFLSTIQVQLLLLI